MIFIFHVLFFRFSFQTVLVENLQFIVLFIIAYFYIFSECNNSQTNMFQPMIYLFQITQYYTKHDFWHMKWTLIHKKLLLSCSIILLSITLFKLSQILLIHFLRL